MVDCPDGSNKIIEWQYPGKEKNRILNADSYSIERETGKCPVLYHAFGTFYSRNFSAGGCKQTAWWRTLVALDGSAVTEWQPIVDDSFWKIKLNSGNFAHLIVISKARYDENYLVNSFNGQIRYKGGGDNPECTNRTRPGDGSDVVLTKLIRVDGQLDDCGDCIFTIVKNDIVVLQKKEKDCPTVDEYCDEKCPSGTCECTHGSLVCCHDPNTGAVVKTFIR